MNKKLISKITGKEFFIVDLITKMVGCDSGLLMPDKAVTYRDGKYNKISITYKGQGSVSKSIFKDNIVITNIFGVFDNAELFLKNNVLNIYKEYQFTIKICDKYIFDINAKLIDLDEIYLSANSRMNEIKSLYNKIKSINLVDPKVFESKLFSLNNYKFTILDDHNNITNLNDITPIVKRFSTIIEDFYRGGMSKVSPMDSDYK